MNKGLSRRQRKNRRRENQAPAPKPEKEPEQVKQEQSKSKTSKSGPRVKNGDCAAIGEVQATRYVHRHWEVRGRVRSFVGVNVQPLDEYKRMRMPEKLIVHILKDKYSLSKEAMAILGK